VETALAKGGPPTSTLDGDLDLLIEASRARVAERIGGRDRAVTLGIAASFVLVAGVLAALPSTRSLPLAAAAALLLTYAVAARIEFELGTGFAIPTQLVLVPMLFVLPVTAVPLLVAAGLVLSRLPDLARGKMRAEHVPLVLGSSWHAVGPAAVLLAAGEPGASWDAWPLLGLAVGAQLAIDFASSAVRDALVLGVSPRARLGYMGSAYVVDAALTPIGFLLALATVDRPYAFLMSLPLLGLLAIFAQERRARIDHALELGQAYRGTAFLLGDVIEADDEYTGGHSRDVVDLSVAVADELGLGMRERRDVEFVALLHDVGKIRVPAAIINKPGKLDAEERRLMEKHTVWGEEMLSGVGGLLGAVGRIVRSCHERYDGRGYPDGLAGEDIPLVARIVCCCDAFSAMTTDRSYRAAMPLEAALRELAENAGTQFDPDVVTALVAVTRRNGR
jgi:HD-GYP domain-containing protein (c-di-GMP phosphodiesterase class II)